MKRTTAVRTTNSNKKEYTMVIKKGLWGINPDERDVLLTEAKEIATNTSYKEKRKLKTVFLEVFKLNIGNVSKTCDECGISLEKYQEWIKNTPYFAKEIQKVIVDRVDFAEHKLLQYIDSDELNTTNLNAIKFFLINKAKERGYQPDSAKGKDSGALKSVTSWADLLKRVRTEESNKESREGIPGNPKKKSKKKASSPKGPNLGGRPLKKDKISILGEGQRKNGILSVTRLTRKRKRKAGVE